MAISATSKQIIANLFVANVEFSEQLLEAQEQIKALQAELASLQPKEQKPNE